jgi:hypothetical protein
MIDECAARVVHVVDMPLDEERETLGHGGVEACKVPCELDAVGTCASARHRRQTTRRQPPTASRMIGSTPASSHCFDDPAQAPDDHPCNGTLGRAAHRVGRAFWDILTAWSRTRIRRSVGPARTSRWRGRALIKHSGAREISARRARCQSGSSSKQSRCSRLRAIPTA